MEFLYFIHLLYIAAGIYLIAPNFKNNYNKLLFKVESIKFLTAWNLSISP